MNKTVHVYRPLFLLKCVSNYKTRTNVRQVVIYEMFKAIPIFD